VRAWVTVVAAGLVSGCGDEHLTVNNFAAEGGAGGSGGGAQGGPGGEGGSADGGGGSTSEGGAGGQPVGAGGMGGEGGGACVPKACDELHGACASVDDGCGGQVDCTKTCTYDGTFMSCGATGLCECSASGNPETDAVCQTQEALDYCEPLGGCGAMLCGAEPNLDVAPGCKWFGVAIGTDVWCCPVGP